MRNFKIPQKTINAIYTTERKAHTRGQKACHLFSANSRGWITYTGHPWPPNNTYTISDLNCNRDFEVVRDSFGNLQALGFRADRIAGDILECLRSHIERSFIDKDNKGNS